MDGAIPCAELKVFGVADRYPTEPAHLDLELILFSLLLPGPREFAQPLFVVSIDKMLVKADAH